MICVKQWRMSVVAQVAAASCEDEDSGNYEKGPMLEQKIKASPPKPRTAKQPFDM